MNLEGLLKELDRLRARDERITTDLEELVKEVGRLHAAERDNPARELDLTNDLTPSLKLAVKALKTLREEEPKSECVVAAYLTCLEMLVNITLRMLGVNHVVDSESS